MNVAWIPPEPRRGLPGEWDKFVGPGQTQAAYRFYCCTFPAHFSGGLAVPQHGLAIFWSRLRLLVGCRPGNPGRAAVSPAANCLFIVRWGSFDRIVRVFAHSRFRMVCTGVFHEAAGQPFAQRGALSTQLSDRGKQHAKKDFTLCTVRFQPGRNHADARNCQRSCPSPGGLLLEKFGN